jgi:hypothetical protein
MTTTEARLEDQKSNSLTTTIKAGSSSQLSLVLALVTLAQFMVVVDATIVQVALPSIGREIRYICRWIAMDSYCLWLDFGRLSDA